jgi:hypothetical protein
VIEGSLHSFYCNDGMLLTCLSCLLYFCIFLGHSHNHHKSDDMACDKGECGGDHDDGHGHDHHEHKHEHAVRSIISRILCPS